MDEVDSIGSARTENSGGGGDSEVQRTMLELLNQLDGFEASNKIKVRRLGQVVRLHCRGTSCMMLLAGDSRLLAPCRPADVMPCGICTT
jgi:SpoVK/Ycf46/Vps4 family AAA+-type ATPase